jgi:hypothetical protein
MFVSSPRWQPHLPLAVLFFLFQLMLAASAPAQSAPGARTDRPIALVGGMLLDGYEAAMRRLRDTG